MLSEPEVAEIEETPSPTDPEAPPSEPESVDPKAEETPAAATARELSSKLARLAERDRRIRERETEFRREELKYADSRSKAEILNDPEKLLAHLETSNPELFQKWAEKILSSDEAKDPAKAAMSEVEKLRAELRKRDEELEAKTKNDKYVEWQGSVLDELKGGDFPLIEARGVQNEVPALILMYYNQTGKEMSVAEAAKLVEEQIESELDSLTKNEKALARVKKKLGWEEPSKKAPPTALGTKNTSMGKPDKKMTPDEKWAAVMRKMSEQGL